MAGVPDASELMLLELYDRSSNLLTIEVFIYPTPQSLERSLRLRVRDWDNLDFREWRLDQEILPNPFWPGLFLDLLPFVIFIMSQSLASLPIWICTQPDQEQRSSRGKDD